MLRRAVAFLVSYIVWLLIVGPYSGARGVDLQAVAVGAGVALLVALALGGRLYERSPWRMLDARRYFWGLVYVPVLLWYILRANLQVAYIVLHPALPIRPGIVRIRTGLRSASGITALANSITLTPGTLSVDATEDGTLYVHWLTVETEEEEGAAREIAGRFEWFLAKIFE